MSLLADLLSKIKHKEQHGAVPPNLARVVQRASNTQKVKTKLVVVLCIFVVLLVIGFGTVYFVNSYLRPTLPALAGKSMEMSNNTETARPAARTETVPAVKVETPVPPPAVSAAGLSTQPAIKVTAPATETANDAKNDIISSKPRNVIGQVDKNNLPSEKIKTTPGIVEASKNGKDVFLYTARTYEEEKNYSQAIAHYKKALEKDPRNYLIMNKLASILITTGSFKESTQYSLNILTIHKNYVPSLVNLGIANIQLGNMAEGEMYLVKAKTLEGSNKMVLFNLGLLYEKAAKYDEALPLFQRLSNMNDIQGSLGMARVLEKQGKGAAAEKIYKEILWMDNTDPSIKQFASERIKVIGNR